MEVTESTNLEDYPIESENKENEKNLIRRKIGGLYFEKNVRKERSNELRTYGLDSYEHDLEYARISRDIGDACLEIMDNEDKQLEKEKMMNYKDSIKAYEECIFNNKDNINVYLELGDVYIKTKQPEKAMDLLLTAHNIQPDDQNICDFITVCYDQINKSEENISLE